MRKAGNNNAEPSRERDMSAADAISADSLLGMTSETTRFSNFVSGETSIGSRQVLTLDFDRTNPDGSVWSRRQYYIIEGTLQYTLGFGNTGRDAMFNTYDRMAKRFVFEEV
jgi:hypothetical protein